MDEGGRSFMWVIGHRGAAGHAPENTMAAFRRGVELGATFLETDLQLTRDARFVCIHDSTLDRTTNGRGNVNSFTLAELRRLDAGSWFSEGRDKRGGPGFKGETIPSLEDLLEFSAEADASLYLELKRVGAWGAAPTLVGAINAAGATTRAVVISFDAAMLDAIRQREPMLMTGLLFDRARPDIVREAARIGARQIAPRGNFATAELVAEARGADLQVVTWTINDPAEIRRVAAAGVHGIITDYPDRVVAALKS
jgi:glycerophosphoryl diester phosphodiesterase